MLLDGFDNFFNLLLDIFLVVWRADNSGMVIIIVLGDDVDLWIELGDKGDMGSFAIGDIPAEDVLGEIMQRCGSAHF